MRVPPDAADLIRLRAYQRLLSPVAWVYKAEELFGTAALLEPRILAAWEEEPEPEPAGAALSSEGVMGVYLMLMAYGVENLLKAALIKEHSAEFAAEVESSHKLPATLRKVSHDLVTLARQVSFHPTRDEEWLLRRLTRAARWSGRYPVPVNVPRHTRMERMSDGSAVPRVLNWPRDVGLLRELIARIRTTAEL